MIKVVLLFANFCKKSNISKKSKKPDLCNQLLKKLVYL